MLQFWRKEKQRSPSSSPQKIHNGNIHLSDSELAASIGPLSHFKQEVTQYQPCEMKSRLTLNLEDVFQNKIALSYFSQYMEAHGYGNTFNLLMEIENIPFKLTPLPPKRTQSLTTSPLKTPPISGSSETNFKNKNCNEPNVSPGRIYCQYLSDDAPNKVRLPEELRYRVHSACSSDFSYCGFDNLKEYIYHWIKKDIWLDFLRSDWFCKYQIEIMTSGKVTLSDVLYNDACLGVFVEFLEQEGCAVLIEFWLTAMNFYKQYSSKKEPLPDSAQIQNDAILIYDKYLSLQATSPLGVNDKVRFAVEEGICGETETAPTCLMPAVCLVEGFLRTSYLRLFFSSNQYLSLLSDVMSSTRPAHSSPASSIAEGSVDTRLPPSEPDVLWRRRRQESGLSFGRVDELGRYETDIEPEPDKRSESRISRVVKLILNKDEHKAQEEMAWRVAEMIVKDITSITMGNSLSEDEL